MKDKVNKIIRVTSKLVIIVLLTTFYLLLSTDLASADNFSLGISPQIIKIAADQGQTVNTSFEIENFSESAVTLSVSFREFTTSDKYDNYIEFKADSIEFGELIENTEVLLDSQPIKRFSINPHYKQKLNINMAIPSNLPNRDFTFTVLFQDISTITPPTIDGSVFSKVSGGIGMNILLSVGKTDIEKLEIKDFSTPFLIQKGPVNFNIRAQNYGNHLINPIGTIRIYNVFGQLVGKFNLPKLNILSKKSRTYIDSDYINKLYTNDSKDIKMDQKIIWPEKFLIGPYTANLMFSLENGETVERTIYFLALPLNVLLIIIVVLGIILLIKKRVNYYLNNTK